MRKSLRAMGGVIALATLFIACGTAPHPSLLGDPATEPSGAVDASIGAPDTGPPTCGLGPAQGVCGCTELPLLGDPPNIYFVLDRSGSMSDDSKWGTIRTVVAHVVSSLGPRLSVGAAVFPNKNGYSDCAAGDEVFSVRRGDTPASKGALSKTAFDLLTATSMDAVGGTPTSATLRVLLPKLKALGPHTFVILATDGGPNCNAGASCDSGQCIPNIESEDPCSPSGTSCCTANTYGSESCLDSTATTEAVAALSSAGIPVYIIGVPGSAPYASLLDQLSVSGGTARAASPKYYRVDSTDTAAFDSAISKVAATIVATCSLSLSSPPSDPSLVNVYTDGTVLPQDPVNGWTLSGSTVTLVGDACTQVLAGNILSVRVIEGCPTVTPN